MNKYSLLKTKLYKPVVEDHYIFRQKIIESLDRNKKRPLTLVVAATGYGKSITVSEWLNITKSKYGWISLDESFNDYRTFLKYFETAVKLNFPNSLQEFGELLTANELPPSEIINNTLINELDEIEEELILVIDDYHLIQNNQIHNLISELLKYPPRNFHTVIIARRDPPIDLSTLKSFGKINQVRMADLNFNIDEILLLSKKVLGREISKQTAELLLKKTEGWIVGICLALTAFNNNDNFEKTIQEIEDDRYFATEYLMNEVFLKQDDNVKKLLLNVSILDRFSEDLIKYISTENAEEKESSNSAIENMFDRFRKCTLFIIPLDESGGWFRLHHFFKAFLFHQLVKQRSKDEIKKLHKRAGKYFYKQNLFEEALQHSVKSNNNKLIGKIFKENKYHLLDTDQNNVLWNWLHALPENIIIKEPHVLLTRALLVDEKSDYTTMHNDLITADKLLNSDKSYMHNDKDQLLGEYHAMHSCLSYISGDSKGAKDHFNNAMKFLTPDQFLFCDVALLYGAFSNNSLNLPEEAVSIVKKNIEKLPSNYIVSRARNQIILAFIHAFQGNLNEILKIVIQTIPVFSKYKSWLLFSISNYLLAEVNYQRNNLESISGHIEKVEPYRFIGRPFWILHCLYTKAFTLNAMCKFDQLETALKEMNSFANDLGMDLLKMAVKACEVEIYLRRNDIKKALELSEGVNFDIYPPLVFMYFPQLTQIKLLFSTDEKDKIEDAQSRLDKLVVFGRSTNRINFLIAALPLQAIFLDKNGQKQKAIEVLSESLTLAEERGFIRNYLDLGSPIEKLLCELYKVKQKNKYLKKIMNEFEKENALILKNKKKKETVSFTSEVGITEQLTAREIEILELVAKGLRNIEIAEKLNLSLDSIKKYLSNTYLKLGVRNRIASVIKAEELELFPRSSKK